VLFYASLIAGLVTGYLPVSANANELPIYLGVIEPFQSNTGSNEVPVYPAVRMSFIYQAGTWQTMPHQADNEADLRALSVKYPRSMRLFIAFDGTLRGQFQAKRPFQWDAYCNVGVFQATSRINLPRKGWKDFDYFGGQQHFRPMVVVSTPNYKDPDGWKRWKPSSAELAQFHRVFRVVVGTVSFVCDYNDSAKSPRGTFDYKDNLIILVKAYRSNQGYRLVSLKIDPRAIHGPCSGEAICERDKQIYKELGKRFPRAYGDGCGEGDEILSANWSHWTEQWFLDKGKGPKFIGRSLELVDAGDYDGDGWSEIVFHRYGYDYDAYVLLFDHLSKQIEFGWIYH
jgi:hypothetical protein